MSADCREMVKDEESPIAWNGTGGRVWGVKEGARYGLMGRSNEV